MINNMRMCFDMSYDMDIGLWVFTIGLILMELVMVYCFIIIARDYCERLNHCFWIVLIISFLLVIFGMLILSGQFNSIFTH